MVFQSGCSSNNTPTTPASKFRRYINFTITSNPAHFRLPNQESVEYSKVKVVKLLWNSGGTGGWLNLRASNSAWNQSTNLPSGRPYFASIPFPAADAELAYTSPSINPPEVELDSCTQLLDLSFYIYLDDELVSSATLSTRPLLMQLALS